MRKYLIILLASISNFFDNMGSKAWVAKENAKDKAIAAHENTFLKIAKDKTKAQDSASTLRTLAGELYTDSLKSISEGEATRLRQLENKRAAALAHHEVLKDL